MKKITFLIFISFVSFGFSQNLITNGDFENGTTGWSGNQATTANIVTVSGNSYFSHNVVSAGAPWDANLSYVLNIPTSGVNYILTFTAWSTANRVLTAGIGLNQDPWTNANQNVNLTSSPQTFVLNFTSNFASPSSRIIFDMGQATGFVNIDNVTLELGPPPVPSGPTTAALTPPARPAADVLSFFSDAYAVAPVTTWGAEWGPEATPITDVTIATNATKRANMTAGKTFFGIVLTNYNDLSSFTHFHIDYWIPSPVLAGQVLSFKLSNHAAQSGETSAIQTLPTPAGGSWVSVDVELATFTAAAANGITLRNSIKEIIVSAARANNGEPLDFYFDNLYFHKNTVLSVSSFEQSNIKMYPNPASTSFTIEAQSSVENVSVYNMLGQEVIKTTPNNQQAIIDISTLKTGVYIVKASINGVISSSRLVKE